MTKISVVIPVYNVEQYLRECLDSVITQTYKNLEIILVNDGSTDSSGRICNEYARKDDRIKVYHKKNGGASDSRNFGLEKVTGDLVTFIDSDDWVVNDYIEILYNEQVKTDADIVIGNYLKYDESDGKFYYYVLDEDFVVEEVDSIEAVVRQSAWKHNTSAFIILVGKLFKKEIFNNIHYPVGKIFEDDFTTHKLLFKSKKTVLVNGNYYFYRTRENSVMTSGFTLKRCYDLVDMINEKLADIVLYGGDLHDARNRAYKLLDDYKNLLEYNCLTYDPIYKNILQKKELYELGNEKNK
ncbi:glycosyltransferase family 2 protein [Gemella sp. GH3]|uniref:glycosyltransferase family 2 protein n=1 Tax=unclassified Gemella TaxID=2624949 RepID=UPI0015D0C06A|nr:MULTISPECIES: glycosyltransferase family 2 protein [unclassified Gemella]MBF0714041.1 glycosyltransferase family 2 protein [Gemella sp. GH3.1]NYS50993.1 glycosyltransferase family 2 protein [Gemella sp. GH3]